MTLVQFPVVQTSLASFTAMSQKPSVVGHSLTMWPTLFITLAIILVIAIPLAIIWRRESAAERMRIDKIASSHTCPVCNGDVIWNGGTWGIDANPPEFSDAGVVLECIECNKQLHLNDRNEIVENALSDYASSNA